MSALKDLLEEGVGSVFPGAACSAFTPDGVVSELAVGRFTSEENSSPVTPYSIFDIASLTKVVSVGAICMKAVEQGMLSFDTKVSDFFSTAPAQVSIKHLLSHSAGLPPVLNVKDPQTLHSASEAILDSPAQYDVGCKSVYSDCGYILLGRILELVFEESLASLTEKLVLDPLTMSSTTWGATTASVPTLIGKTGVVNDPVANLLGGVSGHAGLFSNIKDVSSFGIELLKSYVGSSGFIKEKTLDSFWTTHVVPDSTWVLGWDTPSKENSSAGRFFHSSSVGHLAYTGCSIWLDLDKLFGAVLLSNRTWPDDQNFTIKEFRPKFHEAVCKLIVG